MINLINRVLTGVVVVLATVEVSVYVWADYYSPYARVERAKVIYHELVKQTGVGMEVPDDLTVNSRGVINAYTNGQEVVMYQGMIDISNDDQIALILGHELAHVTLGHTSIETPLDDVAIQHLEASADKMGAYYMMKAGYNVCEGRKLWLKIKNIKGDYLGYDHPNYAYRYDQLNMGCE